MTEPVVKLKRSNVVGRIPQPEDLEHGEIALNYADGVIYFKNPQNTISSITNAEGGGTAIIQQIANDTAIVMAIALG
jgi:hypothetical protein